MDAPQKSLRVLIVEDMQSDANVLVRYLTRAGFAVDHRRVETAEAMRQALADGTWDVILCDHNLPGFDAPGALAIYQECGIDIPFIVVSGAIGEETAVAMMRAGAHDYLLKSNLGRLVPVIERELRDTIARREHRQTALTLRRSERRLRAFYESGVAGVIYWNVRGQITEANDKFLEMVGYSRDDLAAGKIDWVNMTPPEYRELDARSVAEIKATGFNKTPAEKEYIRKDGTRVPVVMAGAAIDEEHINGVAFVLDITERKRAEQAQARRHQEMAAIHTIVTATTSTLDLQQVLDALLDKLQTLSGADRASVMLLDQRSDLLVAAAARDVNGPLPATLRLTRGQGAAGRVLEEARPLIIPDVRVYPDFVKPRRPQPDPDPRVPEALGYAGFPLVSRGRIIGVVSLVTATRREFLSEETTFVETICGAAAVSIDNALAHREIQRRAEKLIGEIAIHRSHAENVLGSITDGVATIDASKRIASWNRGAEVIMGYTEAEVIGKPCDEVFRELGADGKPICHTKDCPFDTVESTGQPYRPREVSCVRPDGQPIAISMSDAPLLDDKGEFQGVVRVFRDFSYERALVDNIQRASRAKSVFLANMSHEIRTPMNAILGFSQILLKDAALTATHRQHLDVIARSGEHLLSLIDDVLDMSRIDAGRAPLAPSSFNLRRLLTDLTSMFRLRAESKGLGFAVTVADGVPAVLLADEKKLRQILINLLDNAVKFTSRGSVQCSVAARREMDGALWLTVDVEDTGPGVPPSETERIFHPFEQTESGASAGGTGLGLTISREFARLMGGDITLDTKVGWGSRFRFNVPVAVGTSGESTPVALRRRVLGIKPGFGPFHVLVVDDRPENRLLLVEMLRAAGFETREATGGEAALALATEWTPDAILMDVRMPGMEGLETIRSLRTHESHRHIPIIAVSASAFEDDRRKALAAGASDFLTKPLRESELLEKLRAGLGIEYVYSMASPREDSEPRGLGAASPGSGRLLLPAMTVEQLRQAAASADYGRIIEILDPVSGTHPEAAAFLREFVERFDYPGLLDHIQAEGEE